MRPDRVGMPALLLREGAFIVSILGNLPDMNKIQAALDEDFAELTARLDKLVDLEQQILDELRTQRGAPR